MTALIITKEDINNILVNISKAEEKRQISHAHILTRGVSGIEWAHYRHPLPEYVCDAYMRYWKDVVLLPTDRQRGKYTDLYQLNWAGSQNVVQSEYLSIDFSAGCL